MNRRIFFLPLPVLLAGIMLFQCTGPTESDGPDYGVLPRALTAAEIELAASADRFGLKLFREVVRQQPDTNIFISPLSVSMALGMTANGAAGATLDAMRATLELDDLTEEESNAAYQSLIELLTGADPEVRFDIAHSIWYQMGRTLRAGFEERCRTYFDAEVSDFDPSEPEETADRINAWVEDKTNGKIDEIVKPIDIPPAVLMLLNALYFKGTWTYEFDPVETVDDQFTRLDGTKVPCRMMNQETDLLYYANDEFQMVDLPYGDGLFSMTVLLPRSNVHVDSLISMMTPDNWSLWIGSLDSMQVQLQLPRFKLEYYIGYPDLNDILSSLGMGVAFSPLMADFSRMLEYGDALFIREVRHKTFVQVDEEGTEAAAVTVVIMWESAGGFASMRVDRPFVFVIRERTSGTMLFMGRIVEPVWES